MLAVWTGRAHPEHMKTLLGAGVLVAVMAAGAISSDALEEVGQPSGPAKEHQREFVTDKKAWTTCVAQAARDRAGEAGRFDPEEACGDKPHPHDGTDKQGTGKQGADKQDTGRQRSADPGRAHGQDRGRPDWAGGPEQRTAEPPGLAKKGPRD